MFEFGCAIRFAKDGKRIRRHTWPYGKYVVYQKGYPQGIKCNEQTAAAFGIGVGELFICNPYLQVRLEDGTHSMWQATNEDILASDWVIV